MERPIFRIQPRAAHVQIQRPAPGHCIAGVGREVQEDLLEGARIGLYHACLGLGVALDLDGSGQEPSQRVQLFPHPFGRAQGPEIENLVTAESQQPVHQLGAAPGGIGQLGQVATQLGRALGRQRFRDQVRLRQNHREQVVEVVGDAGGEPPDGLHLLGLLQGALEGALLGHVLGDHLEAPHIPLLAPHHPTRESHDDAMAVLALPLDLGAGDPVEPGGLLDHAGARARLNVHIAIELEGEHLRLGVVAEHGHEGGIDLEEPALEARAIDAVGRLLDDGAVVGAGAAQRPLGMAARRVFHDDRSDATGAVLPAPAPRREGKV